MSHGLIEQLTTCPLCRQHWFDCAECQAEIVAISQKLGQAVHENNGSHPAKPEVFAPAEVIVPAVVATVAEPQTVVGSTVGGVP